METLSDTPKEILGLRTGSDDITSNMCGLFLVTYHYLSVHFCDSVQSVSSNCCLDDLEIYLLIRFKPVTFTGKARVALHI